MKITEIFVKSGEFIEREMNAQELAQYEIDVQRDLERQNEAEIKAAAKTALLERLGITEDEAKLLFS